MTSFLSDPGGTVQGMDDLDQQVLDFAKLQWRFTGSRAVAIRERFDWTETEYFRRLNLLIDTAEALAAEPATVYRLRRMRDRRRYRRAV
jgi:hypothetical protein